MIREVPAGGDTLPAAGTKPGRRRAPPTPGAGGMGVGEGRDLDARAWEKIASQFVTDIKGHMPTAQLCAGYLYQWLLISNEPQLQWTSRAPSEAFRVSREPQLTSSHLLLPGVEEVLWSQLCQKPMVGFWGFASPASFFTLCTGPGARSQGRGRKPAFREHLCLYL